MDSGLVVMSRREIERAHVMRAVQERRLTQKQAASQLALSVRQVERLFARYKRDGPTGLVSRRRGQRNHVISVGVSVRVYPGEFSNSRSRHAGNSFGLVTKPAFATPAAAAPNGAQHAPWSARSRMVAMVCGS